MKTFRHLLLHFLVVFLVFGCSIQVRAQDRELPPIVFVHGNGDDASKWIGIMWLFESNGYPKDKLFAVRFTNPVARTDDGKPEPNRSSTVDQASELSSMVTRALLQTHSSRVALVGSSRGGLTIRNFLINAGGASVVSHAILCGTPNHGVVAIPANLGSEFNGMGTFLSTLNKHEEISGVAMMTLRSDHLDKYAQPDGKISGLPIPQTGVTYEGPALKGAENKVIEGADHRELAFNPKAFATMYRFLTGKDPALLRVKEEDKPVLSGVITKNEGLVPTNLPASGVKLSVYALKPHTAQRNGSAIYEKTTDDTGAWGPFTADSNVEYEFELSNGERSISYFKAPLPRSTTLLNFRFGAIPQEATEGNKLLISRPEGYFSKDRDPVLLNGKTVDDEPSGLPVRDSFFTIVPAEQKDVEIKLRDEVIYARPAGKSSQLSIVDFLW